MVFSWAISEVRSLLAAFTQGRSDLTDLASTTTGLHTLTISKVSQPPIQLPPSQKQNAIVHRVELLFVSDDRLESRYTATRAQVE